MGTGPLVFTGISNFSSDFQTILSRAVSIAQLPVKALQNHQTDLLQKKQALVGLNPVVSSLGSAIAALGSIAANQSVAASSSDTSKVSVLNTGSTAPASYAITQIQSLASAATERSANPYADSANTAVSMGGAKTLELVYGSTTKTITLTDQTNNLVGVRDAINNLGIGVTATILTTGANANYLSVSANVSGGSSLELLDVGANAGNPDYSIAPVNLLTKTQQAVPVPSSSVAGYADTTTAPVSVAGAKTLQLVYGNTSSAIALTPLTNNLEGVRDAINGLGIGVTASIVASGGKNYLSLTPVTPGNTLQLLDVTPDINGNPDYSAAPVNLIANTNQGSNAVFSVNGVQITRASNAINDVIPGLSFTLQGKTDPLVPTQTVTLSLSTDRSQLASAIQTFAAKFNALADQVDAQTGPAAGMLAGDVLIQNLREDMWQLTTYQGPGGVKNLSDMGVAFDNFGKISFDSSVFNSLSDTQIGDAFKFFGSSKTGFGALANGFTHLSDATTGAIRLQEDGYDRENARISDQITTMNDRIAVMQSSMSAKLQAADALVAKLQAQQQVLTASIQSLNYSLFGVQNSNGSFSGNNSSTG